MVRRCLFVFVSSVTRYDADARIERHPFKRLPCPQCSLLDPPAFPRPTLRLLGSQAGLLTRYLSAVYH